MEACARNGIGGVLVCRRAGVLRRRCGCVRRGGAASVVCRGCVVLWRACALGCGRAAVRGHLCARIMPVRGRPWRGAARDVM